MNELSNFAKYASELLERDFPEKEHDYRSPLQRDRDRIIHAKAFRRLEYKTQVFVNHHGDNFRTRLTHSLEVAQISRTVCRALDLNEDLIEILALAHDLGHPPFGHAGEKSLSSLMEDGFDHNEQTLRVVHNLEKHYLQFDGLNLTKIVRLGLQKHNKLPEGMSHTLEAQIVDICDEIAYLNHDIDDGLESELLTIEQISQKVELWQVAQGNLSNAYLNANQNLQVRSTIRQIINLMVTNLIETCKENIYSYNLTSFKDVLNFHQSHKGVDLVSFSPQMKKMSAQLKKFLFNNLYRHPEVLKMNSEAHAIIAELFTYYSNHPEQMPPKYLESSSLGNSERRIADYIAGMTDRFALEKYNKIKV